MSVLAPANFSFSACVDKSDGILAELQAIVQSKFFLHSRQSCVFLQFVVEQTLRGNLRSLKERTIGILAFGRVDGYDTSVDAFVRVRANEVRRRLVSYYAANSPRHNVRIELPAGAYIPAFVSQPTTRQHRRAGRWTSMFGSHEELQLSVKPLCAEVLNAVEPLLKCAFTSNLGVVFQREGERPKRHALNLTVQLNKAAFTTVSLLGREPGDSWLITAPGTVELKQLMLEMSEDELTSLERTSTYGAK